MAPLGMSLPVWTPRAVVSIGLAAARLWWRGLEPHADQPPAPEALTRFDVCFDAYVGLGPVLPATAYVAQQWMLEIGLDCGDPGRAAIALSAEAMSRQARHAVPTAQVQAMLARARGLAEQADDARVAGLLASQGAVVAYFAGRWAEAEQDVARAESLLRERCPGETGAIGAAVHVHLDALYMQGRWGEVADRLVSRRIEVRQLSDRHGAQYAAHLGGICGWLAMDRPDAAERELDEVYADLHDHEPMAHYWHHYARAAVELYRGRAAPALALLDAHAGRWQRALVTQVVVLAVSVMDLRGRACLAAGLHARAAREARKLARVGAPWCDLLAGLLTAGLGDGPPYSELASRADELGMAAHAAAARWRQAELDGEDRERASQQLRELGFRAPEQAVRLLAPNPG